jgi:hypothetical protein
MRQIRRVRLGLLVVAAAAGPAYRSAAAQAQTCPYVRCFLSLREHPPRVVQGAAATPVARFGLFAPRIDILTASSDSARFHYRAFRANYNRAGVLKLIDFGAWITALAFFAGSPRANHGAAIGIVAGSVPFGIATLVYSARAENRLERAIAAYNRTLPDTP